MEYHYNAHLWRRVDMGKKIEVSDESQGELETYDRYTERSERLGVIQMALVNNILIKELSAKRAPNTDGEDSVKKFTFIRGEDEYDIDVELVVNEQKKVFARVGPVDLSRVGGHAVRQSLIENAVNAALKHYDLKNSTDTPLKYEDVNVAAQTGVRGRAQLVTDFLKKIFAAINPWDTVAKAEERLKRLPGHHMNAYVKVAGEKKLTHWEPRQGPQKWYNDTICAMVTVASTCLFEYEVMSPNAPKNYNSLKATNAILKNKEFGGIFDKVLNTEKTKVSTLVKETLFFKEKNETLRQESKQDKSPTPRQ